MAARRPLQNNDKERLDMCVKNGRGSPRPPADPSGCKLQVVDFERLAKAHKDAVYRQLVRVCGNRDDAEDALVEALTSAYRSLDSLRDEEAFRSWLAQIGRRVCLRIRTRDSLGPIMQLSQMELQGLPEPQSADPPPEDAVALDALSECVSHVVDRLPQAYRDVYIMREIDGLPADEVCRTLNLSLPALKSRLHRARGIVREMLDQNLCTKLL
jgi:RNA polymerase sigma-70 factor, ECF subfamily